MKKFLPVLIFAVAIPIFFSVLMVFEANNLAPKFVNNQLFTFIVLTAVYMMVSVGVGYFFFSENNNHPTIPVKNARIKWAFIPSGLMSFIFFITGFFFSKSSVSCLKPNLAAIMSNEPLNMITCINIKSFGLTKIISLLQPAFMGHMIASTFLFFCLSLILYWLATSKSVMRFSNK